MKQGRFFFLDFLKAISIISVVSFHAIFVPVSTYQSSASTLELIFSPLRFCVPVLLVISFFLLANSVANSSRSKSELIQYRLTRLATPAVFWFSICALMDLATGNSIGETVYRILTGESFLGAYYLIILFQLIPLAVAFQSKSSASKINRNLAIIFSFQVLIFFIIYGLAYGDYTQILEKISLFKRVPFLYWIFYIPLGIWIYQRQNALSKASFELSSKLKLVIVSILGLAFFIENALLVQIFGARTAPFEYLMFSCLLSGPIIFLCCINIKPENLPHRLIDTVSILSRYSLGIFCINGILSRVFLFIGAKYLSGFYFSFLEILLMKLAGWIFLLLISLGGSIVLSRIGFKKFVC